MLAVEAAREQCAHGPGRNAVHLMMVIHSDPAVCRRVRIRRMEELEVGRQLEQQRRLGHLRGRRGACRRGCGPVGSRTRRRRGRDERLKRLPRPARGDPVGHVTLLREVGQVDDPHRPGDTGEVARDHLGVVTAGDVVVG